MRCTSTMYQKKTNNTHGDDGEHPDYENDWVIDFGCSNHLIGD